MTRSLFMPAALLLVFGVGGCVAQVRPQPAKPASAPAYKASAAFAELRLKQAELEAEVESLLEEYTEDYPKVKETRSFLTFLQKGVERLANAPQEGPERFTAALGKLMVEKARLQAELARLLETLQPGHPDVKRAKRRLDIFEAAIRDILG